MLLLLLVCRASAALPPLGARVTLSPAASLPAFSFRHCDGQGFVTPTAGADGPLDHVFSLMAALSGDAGAVSLESANFPGYYVAPIAGAEPGRVGVAQAPAAADASWAVAAAPGGVTLASVGRAGLALTVGGNLTGACAGNGWPAGAASVYLEAVAGATAWNVSEVAPPAPPAPAPHNYSEFWSDYPVRDTCVTYAPAPVDAYFLTGTTGAPTWWSTNTGIQVWTSQDMATWTPVGTRSADNQTYVWTFKDDRTWQNVSAGAPALWAPELHYLKGTFWIPYCVSGSVTGTGLLRSTSGRAEGPYVDVKTSGPITSAIDASLFQDPVSGDVYFLHQNGLVSMMNADMTDVLPNNETLLTAADGQQVGFEGVFAFAHGGRVFLEAARFEDLGQGQVYSCHVAASDTGIYGPYSASYLLDPHCGHSVFFADRQGGLWSTVFGNDNTAPFRERPGAFRIEVNASSGQLQPVAGSFVGFDFSRR